MAGLMTVENLAKRFPGPHHPLTGRVTGYVNAVDEVSFSVEAGQTLAIVGESGSGKTTTTRMLLRLLTPTSGRILLEGRDIESLRGNELRGYRTDVQAVFQDPWASLNPRMRVGDIVAEAMAANRIGTRADRRRRVAEALEQVGLRPDLAVRYPHEFSGGQRQRIAVAAALVSRPKLIVLDEPVSALDVSIRAQVMNLLKDLQRDHGVAFILVAHDLATVRYLATEVAVMYLGRIVERAPAEELFQRPVHPYTRALFAASLPAHPDDGKADLVLTGEVPSPLHPPTGCAFHPRCPFVMDRCTVQRPPLQRTPDGHWYACHLGVQR
ncbi:ABC transporter ATP-binding protein [Dactylosporangium sp. CA-092794]|uniref:ABC transporter ATP-binding protein n=1 Tax=Dactylosporangium sp. CA-092794 TaxID=3239929 RepID=UPI003D8C3099